MATQVTVITGEGSTTYSVSTGARGPAGTGGGGSTPAGFTLGQVQLRNSDGTALAADSGLVYTGTGNTGVLKIGGGSVIMSDPTVSQNVAIGGGNPTLPFANRTSGNYNTVVGTNSLPLLTTGSGNIAIGTSTLSSLLGGNNNVGVGVNALTAVTSGSGNVGIGSGAGAYITTGADNICIGGSPLGVTNISSISIGATGDGSSTTVIGVGGNSPNTQTRLIGNTLILGRQDLTTGTDKRTSIVQTAQTDNKTITLPNATGTVPVYTNAAANGKVLTSSGTDGAATWADPTAGGVTSITAGTGLSGGTITTTGTISLSTTLPSAYEFTNATRPTSVGTGTPAATSLITRADGDTRFGSIGLAATTAITITSSITPQTIRSATLAVGVYYVRMVFFITGTANTGTRYGYDFSGTSMVRFLRSRASSLPYAQVIGYPFDQGLAETSTSAVIEGIINVTVAGTLSMQAAQNTSHADSVIVGASNHMIITPCPNGSIS